MNNKDNRPMSTLAVAGFALTLISAIAFMFIPIAIIPGVAGGVLSIFGMKDARTNNKRGVELAMIGTILAGAFIIFVLLVLYMMFVK